MKKKSLKKKMVMALAGIILAGSMGWSQIPARAAVNGEVICSHEETERYESNSYFNCDSQGHMRQTYEYWRCLNPRCRYIVYSAITYDAFETHDFDWELVEDRGDGLYEFRIWCVCGYEDEVASDDPNDPKM